MGEMTPKNEGRHVGKPMVTSINTLGPWVFFDRWGVEGLIPRGELKISIFPGFHTIKMVDFHGRTVSLQEGNSKIRCKLQSKTEVIWGFKDRYYTCIILFFIQWCKDESTKSLEKGLNAGWGERDFVVVFCFENGCITESSFGAPFCWGISEGAIRSSHFSVSNICCDQPNRRVGSHSQKVMFIVSGNADPQNGRNIKLI